MELESNNRQVPNLNRNIGETRACKFLTQLKFTYRVFTKYPNLCDFDEKIRITKEPIIKLLPENQY